MLKYYRNWEGEKIGRFRAMQPTEEREHGGVVWRMQCTRCGAERNLSPRQAGKALCSACLVRDGYALGILWGLCSKSDGKYYVRSADSHFLTYIVEITGGSIREQQSCRGAAQHVTIVPAKMMEEVEALGWSGRLDHTRIFPDVKDRWAFASAYIQAHCSIDAPVRNGRKGSQYKTVRLRVYGAEDVLRGINEEVSRLGLAAPKTITIGRQHCTLYYQSSREVGDIVSAIEIGSHSAAFMEKYNDACAEARAFTGR